MFSKWLGIGVNIAAFAIHFALLSWLAYMVGGKDKKLAFAVTAVYGCNAAAVSGVMFIRMYEWLSVFVLLCACLHVRAVLENGGNKKSFLLPLMAVNYLGFLTQYYYIIFLAFIGEDSACGVCGKTGGGRTVFFTERPVEFPCCSLWPAIPPVFPIFSEDTGGQGRFRNFWIPAIPGIG